MEKHFYKVGEQHYVAEAEYFGKIYTAMNEMEHTYGDVLLFKVFDIMVKLNDCISEYGVLYTPKYVEIKRTIKDAIKHYLESSITDNELYEIILKCAPNINNLAKYLENYTPTLPDYYMDTVNRVTIIAKHMTRDMSLCNVENQTFTFDFPNIIEGESVEITNFHCPPICISSITDQSITLDWLDKTVEIFSNQEVIIGSVIIPNPHITSEELEVVASVKEYSPQERLDDMIDLIKYIDKTEKTNSKRALTKKKTVLQMVDKFIEDGHMEYYVLKAYLLGCENWSTGMIENWGDFRYTLFKGSEIGCLDPSQTKSWELIKQIAVKNDPANFFDKVNKYVYSRLLTKAADSGIIEAREISKRIWGDNPPKGSLDEFLENYK